MADKFRVDMADGSTYEVGKLLADGDSNTKLAKSNKSGKGFLTVGLSLSPATESGYEVCASRSAGCTKACLFTAGMGVYESVKRARIAKTRYFFQNRKRFLDQLILELAAYRSKAEGKGLHLAVRLNVVSDIQWEKVEPALFDNFKDVQFYDYTKHFTRVGRYNNSFQEITGGNKLFPSNYHLTFSRSESNDKEVKKIIECCQNVNVAVVFDSKEYPTEWHGRKVVNGDETDLRFLDPPGSIIGLYAKGRGRKDSSGFVVSTKRITLL